MHVECCAIYFLKKKLQQQKNNKVTQLIICPHSWIFWTDTYICHIFNKNEMQVQIVFVFYFMWKKYKWNNSKKIYIDNEKKTLKTKKWMLFIPIFFWRKGGQFNK